MMAPVTEETPRDASAASVTASALIELSTMVPDGQKYSGLRGKDSEELVERRLSWHKPGDNRRFHL